MNFTFGDCRASQVLLLVSSLSVSFAAAATRRHKPKFMARANLVRTPGAALRRCQSNACLVQGAAGPGGEEKPAQEL